MRPHVLYLRVYPTMSGHPRQRQMYDFMIPQYYWLCMANDVYTAVTQSKNCAKQTSAVEHKRPLWIFPPDGPLDLITVDTLELLPRTKKGNMYVVVITN